ncbi:MAG TPA: CPBP family intramembrane glutamic endopeptidase [Candidatus Lokiarchaeia archaeon]|nr:CPBP family intramembrane glutamic endopeptidase [Candidatus Lokiarchaeia archaeon]
MSDNDETPQEGGKNSPSSHDTFAKFFYFGVGFTVPFIVGFATYAFFPIIPPKLRWLPLLFIYWGTIWAYTLLFRRVRGGVFTGERFKPTLKLQGDRLWLQYLLTYGPFLYAIPLFAINYATQLSALMYVALIAASVVNGPTEETFWRACMEDAGIKAGVSPKTRLIFTPIVFALWHTAFVILLYPWDASWWVAWAGIVAMTWSSGICWQWVLQKSGRLVPQAFYHACANLLNIFPLIIVTVVQFHF